tara:strand:+ start:8613 stop:8834 length:222 start_codon:yes stop_codon:yes gene_type:complete
MNCEKLHKELQDLYDQSDFDDLKFTIDPEKIEKGSIDEEKILKQAISMTKELIAFSKGERKAEYVFNAYGRIT